jgi:hypothetical protein
VERGRSSSPIAVHFKRLISCNSRSSAASAFYLVPTELGGRTVTIQNADAADERESNAKEERLANEALRFLDSL